MINVFLCIRSVVVHAEGMPFTVMSVKDVSLVLTNRNHLECA